MDRHGRVLPERAAAHLDRMVSAASAALVSCRDGIRNARARTGTGGDAVSSAAPANPVLLYRDSVADRHHTPRELHLSELPGARAGLPVARRPPVPASFTAAIQKSPARADGRAGQAIETAGRGRLGRTRFLPDAGGWHTSGRSQPIPACEITELARALPPAVR